MIGSWSLNMMPGCILDPDGIPRADDCRPKGVGHVRRGRVVSLGCLEERHSRIHLLGFSGNHFGKGFYGFLHLWK